jgi:hypothetical protein
VSQSFDRFLCISVDIKRYSDAHAQQQAETQRTLKQMLEESAASAGLDRLTWRTQDQGDGELALTPVGPDEPRVVDAFVRQLNARLERHNEPRRPDARLRLRVALHVGVAFPAALGFAGPAVVVVSRFLNCDALRQALDEADHASLAVILSETAFEVVTHGDVTLRPSECRPVQVREKGYEAPGWIWIPSAPAPRPIPRPAPRPSPPPSSGNQGIVISGGVINGPMAAGDGATATQYRGGEERP